MPRFFTLLNRFLLATGNQYNPELNLYSFAFDLYSMQVPYLPERIDNLSFRNLELGGMPDSMHIVDNTVVMGVTDLKETNGLFRGAVIFTMTSDGIIETGRVNHLEMVADSNRYTDKWYQSIVTQSMVKDNYVYTLSSF